MRVRCSRELGSSVGFTSAVLAALAVSAPGMMPLPSWTFQRNANPGRKPPGVSPVLEALFGMGLRALSKILRIELPKPEGRPSGSASKPCLKLLLHTAPQRPGACHAYLR